MCTDTGYVHFMLTQHTIVACTQYLPVYPCGHVQIPKIEENVGDRALAVAVVAAVFTLPEDFVYMHSTQSMHVCTSWQYVQPLRAKFHERIGVNPILLVL